MLCAGPPLVNAMIWSKTIRKFLPRTWSLDNFREAMRVTDFWHSLRNSLLISVTTIVLSVLVGRGPVHPGRLLQRNRNVHQIPRVQHNVHGHIEHHIQNDASFLCT